MLGIESLPTAHSQLSPIHILVLVAAGFSLLFAQLPEEAFIPEQWEVICMAQRVSFSLALALLLYHLVVHYWALYEKNLKEGMKAVEASKMDLKGETEMKKEPDSLWTKEGSHPSAFLTTRDARPRVWPFPLGKATASGKELWWETGNSSHVGHFKRQDMPDEKEALRKEMIKKEAKRAARAKKALDEYEARRATWTKRMRNLKIIATIAVISLFTKAGAALCLAGMLYYLLATRIADMLKLPGEADKKDEDYPALKRKKVSAKPGMGMTYLYTPTGDGVAPLLNVPIRSPANKLMTTQDTRYSS